MKKNRVTLAVVAVVAIALGVAALVAATAGKDKAGGAGERPPAVAGRFYPADPAKLRGAVEAYLRDALPPRHERPLALVAPHAGYIFSGQIAADAYRQAMGRDYDLIAILGTNHTAPAYRGVSVYPGTGYRTPLGVAEIDQAVASALERADAAFAYRPEVDEQEHSVEVQVPFVQVAFPGAKIVAAVVGSADPDLCARFGRALAAALRGRRALIVASSDLSHYPAYDDAVAADSSTLAAVAGLDPGALRAAIAREMRSGKAELATCACGEAPITVAMIAARELGATHGAVVSYANSGDATVGEHDRVVGYGAVVLCGGPGASDIRALRRPAAAPAGAALGADDKRALLALARETIQRALTTETTPLARGLAPVLERRQGAFVTLKKNGELRGCIGHMAEDLPLGQVVGAMAFAAAFNDQRFSPLRLDEYPAIEIEISVLTPFAPASGPERIVVGRDGVLLRKAGRSAVFLPQVATEQGWDRDELLDNLCAKAGLSAGCWRKGADLSTFQADVFGEADFASPSERSGPSPRPDR